MKCEICGFETDNGRVMSNHKRWKHLGVSFSEEAYQHLLSKKKKRFSHQVICKKCGKLGLVETTDPDLYTKDWYCSSQCAHSRSFTPESNLKKSEAARSYRKKTGKTIIEDKECPVCGKIFRSRSKTCSIDCGHKLRYKYDFSKKKDYRAACAFRFALKDYPGEFEFELIEKYGWYKATNHGGDGSGVSRDHMVSVDFGWKNSIAPEIISHPANCKLMIHSENFKKRTGCSISVEELLIRIQRWNDKYGVVV